MGQEKYSIEIFDTYLEIYGDLNVSEALTLIKFFYNWGFTVVAIGSQNSTLRMMKRDLDEECDNETIKDLQEELARVSMNHKTEYEAHCETRTKLRETESLMRQCIIDSKEKFESVVLENEALKRWKTAWDLSNNPKVHKIIAEAGYE